MKQLLAAWWVLSVLFITGCDTLSNLPTNTSGGIFSLNGNWQMTSNNENTLTGTVVTVYPAVSDASVTTLANNNKCLRVNDVMWRGLKAREGGGFTLDNLVNACNNAPLYKAATLTIITNDEIRLTGQTETGADLSQTWKRVSDR